MTVVAKIKASPNLVRNSKGRLSWAGPFPTDKGELSALMSLMTEDWVSAGNEITRG